MHVGQPFDDTFHDPLDILQVEAFALIYAIYQCTSFKVLGDDINSAVRFKNAVYF